MTGLQHGASEYACLNHTSLLHTCTRRVVVTGLQHGASEYACLNHTSLLHTCTCTVQNQTVTASANFTVNSTVDNTTVL